LAIHWLCPGNTTQYLCRSNLAASCDCYVALSFSRTAPVESDHHRRVAYFSHALQALFFYRDRRATIHLLRMLHGLILYPDYEPQLRLLRRLICCRSPDGRTRVDAIYTEACTCMKCGGLFEPLKSHHSATFINNFVFALYFV
jgi:hypothetical protein